MRPWKIDISIVVGLALFGFVLGVASINYLVKVKGTTPHFNQVYFDATVMMACDRGFYSTKASSIPALQAFLTTKVDTFDCANLPKDFKVDAPVQWQRFYLYLLSVIAFYWKHAGISWSGLWPIYGGIFAFSLISLYAFFRNGMNQVLAVLAVFPVTFSYTSFYMFPHMYYYLKAPFIFACLAVLARLILRPPQGWGGWLGWPFLLGGILGLSLGFRRDLMAMVPLAMFIILVCPPGNPLRHVNRTLPALACFGAGFLGFGWPLIETLSEGSNSGHIVMLGLSTIFTNQLGIEPLFYDWGQTYNDSYNRYIINVAAWIREGVTKALHIARHDYDVAGIAYFLTIFWHFPADIFLRFLASVKANVDLFDVRGYRFGFLTYATVVLAFLGAARRNLRVSILALIVLLYIAGYPSLLFRDSERFFLVFIPAFAGGVILQSLVADLRDRNFDVFDKPLATVVSCLRANAVLISLNQIILTVATLAATLGLLWMFRAYQVHHGREFLRQYWSADRQELSAVSVRRDDGREIRSYDFFPGPVIGTGKKNDMNIGYTYVVAEFDRNRCASTAFEIEPYYQAKNDWYNFKRTIKVDLARANEKVRVFIPAFKYLDNARFDGISLPVDSARCLASVGMIAEPKRLPVLLFMSMTDTWESERLFMRLK